MSVITDVIITGCHGNCCCTNELLTLRLSTQYHRLYHLLLLSGVVLIGFGLRSKNMQIVTVPEVISVNWFSRCWEMLPKIENRG